jgi:hypothetical protein
MQKFEVLRGHEGDRRYEVGEIREADERDVGHLVPLTLKPVAKTKPAAENKAVQPAQNKAAPAVAAQK